MKLTEVRRITPLADVAAYEAAYAEADLAGRLAEVVHRLRTSAGLTQAALAERLEVAEEDVVRAEDGTLSTTIELLHRLSRLVGAQVTLTVGGECVDLGATGTDTTAT